MSAPAASRTYYISSTSGNDANDGQSPEKAWQHLSKIYLKSISKDAFQPGDTILLKRGDQWDGQIRLQGNGNAQNPITLGAYGEGLKPLIYGDNPDARWEPVAGQNGNLHNRHGERKYPRLHLAGREDFENYLPGRVIEP